MVSTRGQDRMNKQSISLCLPALVMPAKTEEMQQISAVATDHWNGIL